MLCRAAREIPPSGQAREIPPRPRSRPRGNARLEARRAEGGCGRSWLAPGESSAAGGPNQGAPPVGVRRPGERRPAGRRCPAAAFRPLRTGTHSCRGPISSSASRPPRPLGNLSSEKRSPPGPPRRRLRREMFRASRSRPRALPSSGTGGHARRAGLAGGRPGVCVRGPEGSPGRPGTPSCGLRGRHDGLGERQFLSWMLSRGQLLVQVLGLPFAGAAQSLGCSHHLLGVRE